MIQSDFTLYWLVMCTALHSRPNCQNQEAYWTNFSQKLRRCLILSTLVDKVRGNAGVFLGSACSASLTVVDGSCCAEVFLVRAARPSTGRSVLHLLRIALLPILS